MTFVLESSVWDASGCSWITGMWHLHMDGYALEHLWSHLWSVAANWSHYNAGVNGEAATKVNAFTYISTEFSTKPTGEAFLFLFPWAIIESIVFMSYSLQNFLMWDIQYAWSSLTGTAWSIDISIVEEIKKCAAFAEVYAGGSLATFRRW